jgi:hypothetical protein
MSRKEEGSAEMQGAAEKTDFFSAAMSHVR